MKVLACWHPRGRGVFLTIMAVPLFVTVYFLIFLDLDIMNAQNRSPPNYGAPSGRTYIKTIVKLQRALDDLGLDLSNVISHRDYIHSKIKSIINETAAWSRHGNFVDELHLVLNKMYSHNYTSVVKQPLLITCNQMEAIQQLSKPKWRDAYSYTEDGLYGFQQVRTIRSRTDLRVCSDVPNSENSKACRVYANNLALRDIMLFQQLQHIGIGKLIGFCVREFSAGVSYVVGNGKNLNISGLVAFEWNKRLQVLLDLTLLIDFLVSSPIGTLRMQPMHPSSFIINEKHDLELWDLSILKFGEQRCQSNKDCKLANTDHDTPCDQGFCSGLSLRQMLMAARESFFTPLLQNTPTDRATDAQYLLRLLHRKDTQMKDVIEMLEKMGAYPHTSPNKAAQNNVVDETLTQDPEESRDTGQDSYTYRKLANTDLPGHHDYACPRSQVTWGCVVAMPSRDSAFRRCSGDPQCRAFVILPNVTLNGWTNVCYKNAYLDLVDSADSTLYIKVPIRDSTDDLRYGHGDMDDKEEVQINAEPLVSCVTSMTGEQKSVRVAREKRLMALLNMPDLSESQWFNYVQTGVVTSADNIQDGTSQRRYAGPGGSLLLHMKEAPVKTVSLIVKEGPTQFHHAHLLFYYVDRLLGFYLTPPTKPHAFTKDEIKFMTEEIPGFKEKFSALVTDDSLTGILTAAAPQSAVGVIQLGIVPLSNVTSSIVPFTGLQQNHLEYLLLLWLTGTPRHLSEARNTKGVLLHLDSSDALQQGVDSLLPFLYHCQYPRHVVDMLQMLHMEQNSLPSCSFSNQVFYLLQQDNLQPDELHLLFHGTQQLANLLNRSAEKFLDIVNICIKRFGESQVLYD